MFPLLFLLCGFFTFTTAKVSPCKNANCKTKEKQSYGLPRRNAHTTRYVIRYVHKRDAAVIDENVFDYFQSFLIDMFFSLSFCITCQQTHVTSRYVTHVRDTMLRHTCVTHTWHDITSYLCDISLRHTPAWHVTWHYVTPRDISFCRMTNYELLRWLAVIRSHDVGHNRTLHSSEYDLCNIFRQCCTVQHCLKLLATSSIWLFPKLAEPMM